MFCGSCGEAVVDESDLFCRYCGSNSVGLPAQDNELLPSPVRAPASAARAFSEQYSSPVRSPGAGLLGNTSTVCQLSSPEKKTVTFASSPQPAESKSLSAAASSAGVAASPAAAAGAVEIKRPILSPPKSPDPIVQLVTDLYKPSYCVQCRSLFTAQGPCSGSYRRRHPGVWGRRATFGGGAASHLDAWSCCQDTNVTSTHCLRYTLHLESA